MTTNQPTTDQGDAHTTPTRQPAYDATYALIRRLGDHVPTSAAGRNAAIWRAVEGALDAMGVPTGPAAGQPAPDELDLACAIEFFDEHHQPLNAKAVRDLAAQRDRLVAEVDRLRAEVAVWRDDVSVQWHDECIRLQGEVERLTREQLNADIAAGGQPGVGAR